MCGELSSPRPSPRRYSREVRERAVRKVMEVIEESGEARGVIPRVARECGVGAGALRAWVHRAKAEGSPPEAAGGTAEFGSVYLECRMRAEGEVFVRLSMP